MIATTTRILQTVEENDAAIDEGSAADVLDWKW